LIAYTVVSSISVSFTIDETVTFVIHVKEANDDERRDVP